MNVQGPDGSVVNFPDGTDPATIDGVMRQNFPAKAPAQSPDDAARAAYAALPWYKKIPQAADDTIRNVVNGATLGYADKITAKANSFFGGGDEAANLAAERGKSADAMARAGSAGVADNIAGMMAPAGLAAKVVGGAAGAASAVPVVGRILASPLVQAAGTGATVGAVDATGHDQDPATGALVGAAGGAAGHVVASGLGAVGGALAAKVSPAAAPQVTSDFARAAQRAYDASEATNTLVNPAALQRLKATIQQTMYDAGFDPSLHPGGNTIVSRINAFPEPTPPSVLPPFQPSAPSPPASAPGLPPMAPTGPMVTGYTLKGLDGLRQIAGGMSGGTPAGGRLGGLIQNNIDEFLDTLHPVNDLIGGDSQKGVDALNEARGLWQTMSKSRALDEANAAALDRAGATGSGGNITNVTKQNAIRLQNSRNDWTPDEQVALTDLIRGTPTSNALRLIGKLSPGGNGLSLWKTMELTAAGAGAGHLAAGLPGALTGGVGAAVVPTVGMIAKTAADKTTAAAAGTLGDIIRNGGVALPPAGNAAQAAVKSAVTPLSRAFMLGGVNASINAAEPDTRRGALSSVLTGAHPGLGAAFQQ